jgi:flagellin
MPQVINTNVMSLNAQRNLNRSQEAMAKSLTRLSSGLRINSAKDDSAGLAIATRFTAQINGLNQAVRNANDGISLAQTAEGALDEIQNNLQRIRELAVQASNATYSSGDRASLDDEATEMANELKRVMESVEFNGVSVLDSTDTLSFQVGAEDAANNQVSLTLTQVKSQAGVQSIAATANFSLSSQASAYATITLVDTALDTISDVRADFGTIQNRFESTVRNLQNVAENLSASRSRIMDADFAAETAALTRAQILQQAGTAMLAQANSMPQSVLSLLG